jgi:hypothetical protein
MDEKPIIQFVMPRAIMLEVLAFESFARRDLKRVQALEADRDHDLPQATEMGKKADSEEAAGIRLLEMLDEPPVWKSRLPSFEVNACVAAAKS